MLLLLLAVHVTSSPRLTTRRRPGGQPNRLPQLRVICVSAAAAADPPSHQRHTGRGHGHLPRLITSVMSSSTTTITCRPLRSRIVTAMSVPRSGLRRRENQPHRGVLRGRRRSRRRNLQRWWHQRRRCDQPARRCLAPRPVTRAVTPKKAAVLRRRFLERLGPMRRPSYRPPPCGGPAPLRRQRPLLLLLLFEWKRVETKTASYSYSSSRRRSSSDIIRWWCAPLPLHYRQRRRRRCRRCPPPEATPLGSSRHRRRSACRRRRVDAMSKRHLPFRR